MSTLLENTQRIVEMVREGQFVEAMEEFYADDVVTQEASGATTEGKQTCIDNEKAFLKTVEKYESFEGGAVGVGDDDGNGNGTTFAAYALKVALQDGKRFDPDQVQVTRWRDGKAVHVRFYYNPNF